MASPRTINLGGSRAATQQYTLSPGLLQYVQSVYVEIDNTAGGDARPTLTLSEQSGVVIAKKRQGESIPAGDTGTATWALRLTDETASATAALETAKVTWTPAEIIAGATKTVFAARQGTIIYPADFLLTVTLNFNASWGVNPPQLLLESSAGTWAWWTFNFTGGGGGGFWASWYTMLGEEASTPWTDQITGEGMRATVLPNDLVAVTTGQLAAFVTARRIVWTA